MSLINNMLKDLEQRESSDGTASQFFPFQSRKSFNIRFWMLKTVPIFIVAAIVYALYHTFWLGHHKKPVQPAAFVDHSVKSIDTSTDKYTLSQPTSITGVTIQTKDAMTEVIFSLSAETHYRIVNNDILNQVSIYFDDAKLQASLPVIGFINPAISHIYSHLVNDTTTRFTLALSPGASLKYVNLTDDSHPELLVAIQGINKTSAITEIPAETQPVKSPALDSFMQQHYQTALLNAEAGRYQLAIQQLQSLLKMDPEYKDARVSLVALLIDQGQTEMAENTIKQGLSQNADYAPYLELKARLLAMNGSYKQALQVLQSANPPIDENPEYHAFIAAMYEQNNEHALASALYRRLLALNANNSSWWFGLGVSLDKQGQRKNAIEAFTHAATLGRLNSESLVYVRNRLKQLQEGMDEKE